jgi:hypothetical protein
MKPSPGERRATCVSMEYMGEAAILLVSHAPAVDECECFGTPYPGESDMNDVF